MSDNQSLIRLVQSSNSLVQALLETGGELTPEIEAALAHIDTKLPEKVDSYQSIMDRLEIESEYWALKADQFKKMATACKNARERLKDNIKYAMNELGQTELVGNDFKFKLSNSKPKLVVDDVSLDRAYFMQVTETVVDKKRIEEDLRLGIPVKGAKLEEVKSLRSSLNKGSK